MQQRHLTWPLQICVLKRFQVEAVVLNKVPNMQQPVLPCISLLRVLSLAPLLPCIIQALRIRHIRKMKKMKRMTMRRMRSTRMKHIVIRRVLQGPTRITPQAVMVCRVGQTATILSDPESQLQILFSSSAKSTRSKCR